MYRSAPEFTSDADERHAPTAPERGNAFAGGVRWIGVTGEGRLIEGGPRGEREGSGRDTVVFGSSHGPRLLDILGSSAAL